MFQEQLTIPTYSKWMYLKGYTPQEIFAAGRQHFFELSTMKREVPKAMEEIIEEALDDVLQTLK